MKGFAEMTNPLDAALEIILPVMNDRDPKQALIGAKCFGLMHGYSARWKDAPFKIESVERVLTSDLFNPETTRKSRTFTVAGKLDVRAVEIATGKRVVFDHKTSTEDISDPAAPFWKQLVVEGQATHYMLLEWLNGEKVDAAVWDVVRKPGISPRALTKAEKKSLQDGQPYFNGPMVSPEVLTDDFRETPHMYAYRLAQDCTVDRAQWYFQRRQIPRLDAEVREYATDQWDVAQEIMLARKHNRWPRNSGACMLYHRPCKYLGICSGHDTAGSGNWQHRDWVHPELPIIEGSDGKDILTNSRMRTFQSCKRKHQFQYEIGLEKIEEEEAEALYFGNLFHLSLEQFFLTIQRNQVSGT